MGYTHRIGKIIDEDIKYCENTPMNKIPYEGTDEEKELYRKGFIDGLNHAKYLVGVIENTDKQYPLETVEDAIIMVEDYLSAPDKEYLIDILKGEEDE